MATDFSRFPKLRAAALPAEDQDVLRSLPPNELPAWIDARVEELLTRVATLQHLRNTQCPPVSHLPNEVLMKVFGEPSLADDGNSILGVCRLWRSILLDTTLFWANYISEKRFISSERHKYEWILPVALLHSGALPISLKTGYPDIHMLRILKTCRGRITKWDVKKRSEHVSISGLSQFIQSGSMTCLHTLSVNSYEPYSTPLWDWDASKLPALRSLDITGGSVTPSIMASSLESLRLCAVHGLTHHSLVAILKKCPILTMLELYPEGALLEREQQASHSASPTVELPQLRQLEVSSLAWTDVDPFLRLFVCIPEHAFVHLRIGESKEDPEFQLCGISSLSLINRLCIISYHSSFVTSGYVDSHERLRIRYSTRIVAMAQALQPFLVCPLNALVFSDLENTDAEPQNIREHHGHIFALELPHLRRLELPHGGSKAAKQTITELFLGRYRARASELSLAWVLSIDPKHEAQPLAAAEVEGLLAVLREHVRCGNPRLGRLELYAVEYREWWDPKLKGFSGDIKEDSDARTCSRVVEPILEELRGLVDEVHIG